MHLVCKVMKDNGGLTAPKEVQVKQVPMVKLVLLV